MCKKLIFLISFILVLALTTTVANAEVDLGEGLVAYWPLDEGTGATTADKSGNGNHGTFLGAPAWDSGKLGGALDFDGIDDVVDCGLAPELNFRTGDFSISLWVKVSVDPGTGTRHVFQKGDDDFDNWAMEFRDNDGGDIEFEIEDGTDHKIDTKDAHGTGLIDDEWHHIVMMRKDSTKLRVYVDGAEDMGATGESAATIPADYDIDTTLGKAYIGANHDSSPGKEGGENFFLGLIDDVAVWDRALTQEDIDYLWNGGAGDSPEVYEPKKASDPNPADGAEDVPRDVVLSWTPGAFVDGPGGADDHRIDFSENEVDVNDGAGGVTQDVNTYTPPGSPLDFGKTYFWRVDEANSPWDIGNVWQFTVEPVGYPLTFAEMDGVNASSFVTGKEPDKTADGSGLDANDAHSIATTDMWQSQSHSPGQAWIEYEFDKVYKLHELWVWNYNGEFPLTWYGIKNATIKYSTNGTDYTTLGATHEFTIASGGPDYVHNTTIDLGGAVAKYVRIIANSNHSSGAFDQYGLSEVRFFYMPMRARYLAPGDQTTVPDTDTVVLKWKAGREAAEHKVYFSEDEQAVINGTASVGSVYPPDSSYGPLSLNLGETYYWKINEVNLAETPSTWQGDVRDFSTQGYFIVEDFESYNDTDNLIYNTWIGGGGAVVYLEKDTVQGGSQAMNLYYDNYYGYSETDRTYVEDQNWTAAGVKALRLRFRGKADNIVGEDDILYVLLKDEAGKGAVVTYGEPNDLKRASWQNCYIALQDFVDANSVNLAKIRKVTIGIGERGAGFGVGYGDVYIDNIRLYPSRCVPSMLQPAADLDDDCDVDYDDLDVMLDYWLMADHVGTGELLLHWKFDENSGTTAGDSSKYDHAGDINNATWVAPGGHIGVSCLNFNGLGDYVLDNDANLYLDGLHGLTVALWVKSDEIGTNSGFIIFEEPSGGDKRNIRYDSTGSSGGGTNLIKCGVWPTEGNQEYESSSNVQTTDWQHLALTWTSGDNVKLYINGVEDTPTWRKPAKGGTLTGYDAVVVGKGGKDENPDDGWDGLIDDVQIYNYALSETQIKNIVMVGETIPDVENLWYPFLLPAELYDGEAEGDRIINLRDFAVMAAEWWLEEQLWP